MPDSVPVRVHGPFQSDIVRVTRHLRRLEAIAARYRSRRRIIRLVRGGVSAVATFLLLVKAGFEGSLSDKVVISALVGLGFALPLVALFFAIIVTTLANWSGYDTFRMDRFGGCFGANARRARLDALIAQRRAWLADPTGDVPRIRDDKPAQR